MKLPNIPSILWIVIIPVGVIIFIGAIITGFTALATVEGFASIIILVVAIVIFRGASTTDYSILSKSKSLDSVKPGKETSFGIALAICFFALMGMSIDQPGNILYNKPIELLFCPQGTYLTRDSDITNPLPGRTDITQDFRCVNDKETVRYIDMFEVMFVRFVEYVIIGYILIYGNKLLNKFISRRKGSSELEKSSSFIEKF